MRVRPPVPRELHGLSPYQDTVHVDQPPRNITISENLSSPINRDQGLDAAFADGFLYSNYKFAFDRVYDQESSQDEIYSESARDAVVSVLKVS